MNGDLDQLKNWIANMLYFKPTRVRGVTAKMTVKIHIINMYRRNKARLGSRLWFWSLFLLFIWNSLLAIGRRGCSICFRIFLLLFWKFSLIKNVRPWRIKSSDASHFMSEDFKSKWDSFVCNLLFSLCLLFDFGCCSDGSKYSHLRWFPNSRFFVCFHQPQRKLIFVKWSFMEQTAIDSLKGLIKH